MATLHYNCPCVIQPYTAYTLACALLAQEQGQNTGQLVIVIGFTNAKHGYTAIRMCFDHIERNAYGQIVAVNFETGYKRTFFDTQECYWR